MDKRIKTFGIMIMDKRIVCHACIMGTMIFPGNVYIKLIIFIYFGIHPMCASGHMCSVPLCACNVIKTISWPSGVGTGVQRVLQHPPLASNSAPQVPFTN